jgi:DNA-binding MarR family transcriptional regulator
MTNNSQDVEHLVSAIGLLLRRLRAERVEQNLSWNEMLVMGRLARGGAATTADLARAEGIKPQSMGAIVASLAQAGIVQRKPHPTDGRQSLVELSPQGVAIRDKVKSEKRAWLEQAISQLPPADRNALFAASGIIERLANS